MFGTKSKRHKQTKRRTTRADPMWVERHARKLLVCSLMVAALLATLVGITVGMARLETYVHSAAAGRIKPVIQFVDLPGEIDELAGAELAERLETHLTGPWTDRTLPQRLADLLESSGWVEHVNYVRRTGGGVFLISCRYYQPLAMVQKEEGFYLIERAGVRLPGVYRYDPTWLVIQGIDRSAPPAGTVWGGADVRAGLDVAAMLLPEPMAGQITGVLVDNFEGRLDRRRTHIELATDRAGGRIQWGSAPGRELEENSIQQKLAILRDNFHRTGRVDAHHPIIDVSVFADRFVVPG